MKSIDEVFGRIKTITFDCYGTLIDWQAGIELSLQAIFGAAIGRRMHEVFAAYLQIEKEVQAEEYRPYRQVLAVVVERLAERFDIPISPERSHMLARMLPNWKPFGDTNEALVRLKQRYGLGILSNIDKDLFAGTDAHFDVVFDFVITAEDVGSYKPAHGHFERLLESYAERDSILHVAQSLFHDGVPANELGLAYVWINRYKEVNTTTVRLPAEYPDLKSLADVLCR